jgi:hypothetical protein
LLENDIVGGIGAAIRGFLRRPQTLKDYGENARVYVERSMGEGAFARNGQDVLERIERDILKKHVPRPIARKVDTATG